MVWALQVAEAMPAIALSTATFGIDAYLVHVEVDTDRQLPSFTVVGLPDNAVRESRERVMAGSAIPATSVSRGER
jgi:hypothetical protein